MLINLRSISKFNFTTLNYYYYFYPHLQSSEEHPGSHIDFARKRLQLAESLYYKTLENIMLDEKHRLDQKKQSCDFSVSRI